MHLNRCSIDKNLAKCTGIIVMKVRRRVGQIGHSIVAEIAFQMHNSLRLQMLRREKGRPLYFSLNATY